MNNSFRNTGLARLPAAEPSWIKYGDAGSPPEFGGGSESPMGGEVYRYDAGSSSTVKFPQSLDGRYFAWSFGPPVSQSDRVWRATGTPGLIEGLPVGRHADH
ncbi:hypothetical protein GCM10020220_023170 [Nonomuraea rubra]|uniref:hypothetical protein n=1 Tax=Nonomuraea rubra TaxID=46180 RepID=UPI0031EFE8E9